MKFITIVSAFLFALVESRRRNTPPAAHPAPAAASAVPVVCKTLTLANCANHSHCKANKKGTKCKNATPKTVPKAPKPNHRRDF